MENNTKSYAWRRQTNKQKHEKSIQQCAEKNFKKWLSTCGNQFYQR